MEKVQRELKGIIDKYVDVFSAIPDSEFSAKPRPNKWSKKEVVGHLTDSAQNNVRRFICGQYEASPPKITYEQDLWVKANDYHNRPSSDVIALWRLLNEQICAILKTMPAASYSRTCNTGKETQQLHSLLWLAEDYVKHLKHHINQVIPGSFDIIYK